MKNEVTDWAKKWVAIFSIFLSILAYFSFNEILTSRIDSALKEPIEKVAKTTARIEVELENLEKTKTSIENQIKELSQKKIALEKTVTDLNAQGDQLAALLKQDSFVLALQKISSDVYRIKTIEARVRTVFPVNENSTNATDFPFWTSFQVDLMDQSSPDRSTSLAQFEMLKATGTYVDDDVDTVIADTSGGLWQLFKERLIGREIDTLKPVTHMQASVFINGLDEKGEPRNDIVKFFNNIDTVRVQVIVNGYQMCEHVFRGSDIIVEATENRGKKVVMCRTPAIMVDKVFFNIRPLYEVALQKDTSFQPKETSLPVKSGKTE